MGGEWLDEWERLREQLTPAELDTIRTYETALGAEMDRAFDYYERKYGPDPVDVAFAKRRDIQEAGDDDEVPEEDDDAEY
jgi:hypothetical protein